MGFEATDPSAEYRSRLGARRLSLARLQRGEAAIANARALIFVVAAVVGWLAGDRRIAAGWVLVPFAGFAALVAWHIRLRRAIRRAGRAVAYHERGVARVEGRWAGSGESGSRFLDDGHPYAADLDLFGDGSVFQRVNTARTAGGEAQLAHWLTCPAVAVDEIQARQGAVSELAGRLDLREELDLLGDDVRLGLDPTALVAWGRSPPLLPRHRAVRLGSMALAGMATAALGAWAFGLGGPSPFLLAALGELAFWGWLRARSRRVLSPLDRRAGELALLAELLRRLERERFDAPRLRCLQAGLTTDGEPPSRRIARLARLLRRLDASRNPIIAPVSALMLAGTRLAFEVEAWRLESGPSIDAWLAIVSAIEATCSLGAYAFENPADPYPEIVNDGPLFDGDGVGHPLIPEERSVRNDVRLGGDTRVLVVSGSNMSGKSTLLRTVGVNVVLASMGAPVRARRLRLSPMTIGATLRVQDSLQAGTSRFYAELTRLRQVVALAGGEPPLLFLLDEIFHGTNSDDRRVGAEGVIRGLIAKRAIGLVTTHDLALAAIAEGLSPRAANVHFSDRFENGSLQFDYTMKPGVVRHSNALALMRAVGLDV